MVKAENCFKDVKDFILVEAGQGFVLAEDQELFKKSRQGLAIVSRIVYTVARRIMLK